jgi:hypothetical protein
MTRPSFAPVSAGSRLLRITRALPLTLLALVVARTASAQLINIRTVPIAQADQFDILPSQNAGMGGALIALQDTLLDPFRNPAAGARLRASRIFSSPALYSVSSDAGSGRALPLGAYLRAGRWFGALAVALQQLESSGRIDQVRFLNSNPPLPPGSGIFPSIAPTAPHATHGNDFVSAVFGRQLSESGLSLAGSVGWAGLKAVDGVDQLYPGSQGVDQAGHSLDIRLGLLKEFADSRSFEAVVLRNEFAMRQGVAYLDPFWDPATQQTQFRERDELNLDQTNTWGLNLQYSLPLAAGWRIGWMATANSMSHPHIPDYQIMNIPRDPGRSAAFDFGMGVSRRNGPATFGLDVVFEPIWTHTWAGAAAVTPTAIPEDTLPIGATTIDNHFQFSNALVRMGVGREVPLGAAGGSAIVQFGLTVQSVRYRLIQNDNVQASTRNFVQSWVEWAPTWGLGFHFAEFDIRYRGSITNGTGRPGGAERADGDAQRERDRASVFHLATTPLRGG